MLNKSSIRFLLLANLAGRLVYALASIVSPWITKLREAEAVGLVGFFNTTLRVAVVFEGGITRSLVKKRACSKAKESLTSVRYKTFSGSMALNYFMFFVLLEAIIESVLSASSKMLVNCWLRIGSIPESEVVESLICVDHFNLSAGGLVA